MFPEVCSYFLEKEKCKPIPKHLIKHNHDCKKNVAKFN